MSRSIGRSTSTLVSSTIVGRRPLVGLGRHRSSSRASSSTSSPPPSPSLASSTSSLLLAATLGATLASAASYAFPSTTPIALESAAPPSLALPRAQRYGSPADYKAAIDELRVLFPDDSSLTLDPDDLLQHGGSSWTHLASQPPSVVVLPRSLARLGHKLFLPLDPGPAATIGGMISTGCSGTNTVRYGTARAEWFLNLTAVLPSGEIIKTRQRARKSSAGPDLTKLFIGAEGSLGVITEVTIRLAPLLPTRVGMVGFPGVQEAVEAVVEILGDGVAVQCVELLDDLQIEAINKMGSLPAPLAVRDTIFFKFQGSPAVLKDSARVVEEIIKRHGGDRLALAEKEAESEQLWGARRGALFSSLAASGYETPMIYGNDLCVPVSARPAFVAHCKKTISANNIYAPVVGHVGDGNVHLNVVLRDRSELPRMDEVMKSFIWKAIEMDGTCTGEHGVGANKKKYLTKELGDGTIHLLRTIKDAIDPLGLMNPGKLYPDELPPLALFPDPSKRLEVSYPPANSCSC